MEIDKRNSYKWIIAILVNVIVFLGIILYAIYKEGSTVSIFFVTLSVDSVLIPLCATLFLSFVPAVVANLRFKYRNIIGLGIPAAVLCYAIIHFYSCTGKFCNLLDIPLAICALIFSALFTLYLQVLKRDKILSLSIIGAQVLLIVISIIIIFFNLFTELKVGNSLGTNSSSDQEAVLTCDQLSGTEGSNCWDELIRIRQPETNICVFASKKNYPTCIYSMRKLYTNYYHDLNPDPKLASFCKNIGNETMNVYGIKSIDEFISPNADRNENLKEAMGLIRACEYGSGPFEDVSAAFNALEAYDTVSYCEMVKDPDIKTKCISAVNQANQLDN